MESKIQDLLKEIKKLKEENKKLKSRKKYGLVWEEEKEPEQVVLDCQKKLPILKEVKNKAIITDENKPVNILIEGDNYHALQVLNYTHKGKVDVIYIDPPYNTGKSNEWKYNDKFVDSTDSYKHSKWLNFMSKRLILAKNLLSSHGVIFISIDDNEQAQLKLLCDEIFGEKNFESFLWKKKGGAGNTEKIIGCLTEYILCFFKQKKEDIFNYRNLNREYKYQDDKGLYNLAGIEKTNLGAYERATMQFPIIDPKTKTQFLPSKNMRWTIGKINAEKAILENKIHFDHKKKKVYYIKRPEDYENSKNVYYNLLTDLGSLATAKKELEDLFGNREIFDTPKPTQLIIHLLEISANKNSIILDFFAGSGTTGEAVLKLNLYDKGNRKFILCSNNESNICEEICYERIKKLTSGYIGGKSKTKFKPVLGNLKYFKTDFIDVDNVQNISDKKKIDLTYQAGELIAVKEDVFEEVEKTEWWQIFKSNKKTVAIYFKEDQEELEKLFEKLKKTKSTVYLFSWGKNELSGEDYNYPNIKIKDIPQPIIEVYKEINKL